MPGQGGAVAAGAFNADAGEHAETGKPAVQPPVAVRGGREAGCAEDPAEIVERRRHVHVGVGVDTA